jgi:hypothetical protein
MIWGGIELDSVSFGALQTLSPAIGYLVLLFLFLDLLLGGLAFWMDRFRIPVLLPLLLLSAISWSISRTDHYYTIFAPPENLNQSDLKLRRPADPDDAMQHWLARWHDGQKPVVVVVCASGGGIEASAWLARVLTGLEENPELGINSGSKDDRVHDGHLRVERREMQNRP